MATPLAPLAEFAHEEEVAEEQIEARSMAFFEAAENDDSGRETSNDTDSEAEDAQSVLGQLIEDAFGWNVSVNQRIFLGWTVVIRGEEGQGR